MGVTDNTALAATKQAVIAALIQQELISESVVAPLVLNVSQFAKKGAKSVEFPKAGSFTAENRASGIAAALQNLTFATDKLDLNYRATVSWLIDSMDEIQSVADVEGEYAARAARAHGVYVEQQLLTEMGSTAVVTTSTGDLSDDVILEMRSSLLKRKAKIARMSLLVSPYQEAILLKISKFVSAQEYGNAVIPTGALGKIYGVPVYVSTEMADGDYFMFDKEGICIGFQREPMQGQRDAPEYGAGSQLKVLDQLFGVKGLQIAQQGVASGKSALIVSDNN